MPTILAIVTLVAATSAEDTKNLVILREKFTSLDDAVWSVKLPLPGSGAEIRKDELVLKNRAYIQSRKNVEGPLAIDLQWTFEETGGKKAYADVLQVTWKSTGALESKGTRELSDGLQVRITPGYGLVQIQQMAKGEVTEIARKEAVIDNDESKPAWPEGAGENWYHVKIDDDGVTVTASVMKKGDEKPFISVSGKYNPKTLTGKSLVIGNREVKAGADMVSFIKDLTVKSKKK